ncbi:septum formation initiator family protein [Cohnella sp. CFH 77786]|uniref:FtsB family cell division protein n=1 Tax=Cohnella sp. CFH 77786 TaxID=2662265 RepID=UPI001C60E47A|nr:septum formation initiator family protein [Cohnella sp. CFH 77786]MBW5449028.1 septum formation initiator family protein [Cohnella sp. CFH 77786]
MSSRQAAATPSAIGARRRLKLLMVVMVLFMSWAAYILVGQYGQMSDRRAQLQETGKKLSDALAKSEALKQETIRLNDPEYIGQIARKEQGMGLPGEQPIQIEKSAP